MEVNIINIKGTGSCRYPERNSKILAKVNPCAINVVVNGDATPNTLSEIDQAVENLTVGKCSRLTDKYPSIPSELRSFLMGAGIWFIDSSDNKSFLYAPDKFLNSGYRVSTLVVCKKFVEHLKKYGVVHSSHLLGVVDTTLKRSPCNLDIRIYQSKSKHMKFPYGSKPEQFIEPELVQEYVVSINTLGFSHLTCIDQFAIQVRVPKHGDCVVQCDLLELLNHGVVENAY